MDLEVLENPLTNLGFLFTCNQLIDLFIDCYVGL